LCRFWDTTSQSTRHYALVRSAQPDVIVVDLNLPFTDWRHIVSSNTLKPEAIVIVFSAMNDPDLKQRFFEI
jgi:DNA-binding NarL/FixJ family response regulator